MMLLLAAAAHAELPWECPAIATAEDAEVYRDTEAGLDDLWSDLANEAQTWIADDCAWTDVALTDWSVESTCVTSAGATVVVVDGEYDASEWPETSGGSVWSITVDLPVGAATWTYLSVGRTNSGGSSGMASSSSEVATAEWTGSVAGAPDDGSFESSYTTSCFGTCEDWRTVTTPSCEWSWYRPAEGGYETVTTAAHTVEVTYYWLMCREYASIAYVDGTRVGRVDASTWARDPSDADGDGWPAGTNDCDDTDPERYVCGAVETANDGIDQDCDGADLVDWDADNDGHDDLAFGGGDCDDADTDVHPGADDPIADGLDQDCDGADDIDADGDGFTADGDDEAADCDDTDPDVYPGKVETRYDGLDQDCDGADMVDADRDDEAAIEAGGPDCDDEDADINTSAAEVECDGIDQDCDGADDCPEPTDTGEPPEEEPAPDDEEEEATGCATVPAPPFAAFLLALVPLARRRRAC